MKTLTKIHWIKYIQQEDWQHFIEGMRRLKCMYILDSSKSKYTLSWNSAQCKFKIPIKRVQGYTLVIVTKYVMSILCYAEEKDVVFDDEK